MFDDATFNSRHGETVGDDDPLLALIAEHNRIEALHDEVSKRADEAGAALPEEVRRGVPVSIADEDAPPMFFAAKSP